MIDPLNDLEDKKMLNAYNYGRSIDDTDKVDCWLKYEKHLDKPAILILLIPESDSLFDRQ